MPRPLEDAYAPLRETLPTTNGHAILLTTDRDRVGTPQDPLQSNRLVIQAGTHQYNEAPPVEIAYLYGSTAAVESLGLLLFAALLDPQGGRRNLTLTHPHSDVKEIRLACPATPPQNELLPPPTSFRYTPHAPRKHPWLDGQYLPRDLPHLTLSHSQHAAASQNGADTLLCTGSAIGTALLAELLLNATRPGSIRKEYALESEAGSRGVAPGSAELGLILPGHELWPDDYAWS